MPKTEPYFSIHELPEDLRAAIVILTQLRKQALRGEITFQLAGDGLIHSWKITECQKAADYLRKNGG